MNLIAFVVAVGQAGWFLGPDDVKQVPSATSRYTQVRQDIEDRFFATPFYERKALAGRERDRSRGLPRLIWESLAPSWREAPGMREFHHVAKGSQPNTKDREVLRARMLVDRQRLHRKAYWPLAARLLAQDDHDYRLLSAAAIGSFLIGGDMSQGLPYAREAAALRPNEPASWQLLADVHYLRIRYGVGGKLENAREFLAWGGRFRSFAQRHAEAHTEAQTDVREFTLKTKEISKLVK